MICLVRKCTGIRIPALALAALLAGADAFAGEKEAGANARDQRAVEKDAAPAPSEGGKSDAGASGKETESTKGGIDSGGFGGPVVKVAMIQGGTGCLVGGRAGWIINHMFILGGGGFGLVTTHNAPSATPNYASDLRLGFGYGGVLGEWVYAADKIVHMSLGLLLGGGAAGYYHKGSNTGPDPEKNVFFIAEPEAAVEINATSFFRINIGASYRFTSAFGRGGVTDRDVRGPAGNILLRFGRF